MSRLARWGARVLASVSAAVLLVGSGSAALAETPQEGFWYFDTYGVQDAHDAGFTGSGVTIAVLDSQINLEVPTLQGADIEVQPSKCFDESGALVPSTSTSLEAAAHGTNVVSLIAGTGAGYPGQSGLKGVAPGAKVLYYMAAPPGSSSEVSAVCLGKGGKESLGGIEADYINDAVAQGAQIISVSLGMDSTQELVVAVANAEHKGVVVVGALPNELDFTVGAWPGAANGAVAVQRMDSNGVVPRMTANSYDPTAVVAGPGTGILSQGSMETGSWQTQILLSGTSLATPVVSGFLALVKQKYPKATGNQLIQTLILNTGLDDHELNFSTSDGLGYGVASLTHMLRVDPTQYPDVNPLIKTEGRQLPSAEMIANPPGVDTPLVSPTAPPPGAEASPSWVVPVVIGGVIFLLIVVGLIILVVVLATRRAKQPPTVGTGL